jgi:WD40 repeat protein
MSNRWLMLLLGIVAIMGGCGREETGGARVVPQIGPVRPRRVECSRRDAGRFLVLEADGRVGIWTLDDSAAPTLFAAIPAGAIDATFAPDGRTVVTGGADGRVRWWSSDGRLQTTSPESGEAPIRALVAGTDLVAAGREDGTISLWRSDGSRAGDVLRGHGGPVVSLAITPSADIWSAAGDGTLRRWTRMPAASSPPSFQAAVLYRQEDPPNPEAFIHALTYDPDWGWDRAIAVSPGGDMVGAALLDGSLGLWNGDGSPRRLVQDAHAKRHLRAVAFSPAGDLWASGGFDGMLRLWNLDGTARGQPIQVHHGAVFAVTTCAGGKWFATAGGDNRVRFWNADGTARGELPRGARLDVGAVAVSRGGRTIGVVSAGSVRLWGLDGSTGAALKLDGTSNAVALAFLPTDDGLAIGAADGRVSLWGLDGSARGQLQAQRPVAAAALAFLPSGGLIAGSDAVRRLNLHGGAAWELPVPRPDAVTALAVSPRGDLVAAGSWLGRLLVSNAEGAPWTPWLKEGRREDVRAVAFLPGGAGFASAGASEPIVRLWGLNGAPQEPPLGPQPGLVKALALSDVGLFASGSSDGTVRLWRLPAREFATIDVGLPIEQLGFVAGMMWARAGSDSLFLYDRARNLAATVLLLRDGVLVFTPDGWVAGPPHAIADLRAFDPSGEMLSPRAAARRLSPDRVRTALAAALE